MSTIKFTDVLACSSEDPIHRAENLLKSKKWLSKSSDTQIEVVLRMDKEHIISFIDIGNHGSLSAEVLVSHSLRSRGDFFPLIPKCMLMSVAESKQYVNIKQVHMFRKDQMLSTTRDQTWDILKIICSQPYFKLKQSFGLSFLTIKSSSNIPSSPTVRTISPKLNDSIATPNTNRSKLKSLLNLKSPVMEKTPTVKLPPKPSLKTPEPVKAPAKKLFIPSTTPKALKIFSPAAKAQFLGEIECFLKAINFEKILQSDTSIKVSDLRQQLEKQRGQPLSKFQKKLFFETIKDIMEEHRKSKIGENSSDKENVAKTVDESSGEIQAPVVSDTDKTPTTSIGKSKLVSLIARRTSAEKLSVDVPCRYCKAKIPRKVLTIHESICAPETSDNSFEESNIIEINETPPENDITIESAENNEPPKKKFRHRNSLLFDVSDDEGEQDMKYSKKKFPNLKLFANAQQSVKNRNQSSQNHQQQINTNSSSSINSSNNRTGLIKDKISPQRLHNNEKVNDWLSKNYLSSNQKPENSALSNQTNKLQNISSTPDANATHQKRVYPNKSPNNNLPNKSKISDLQASMLLNGIKNQRISKSPKSQQTTSHSLATGPYGKTGSNNNTVGPLVDTSSSKQTFMDPHSSNVKVFQNASKSFNKHDKNNWTSKSIFVNSGLSTTEIINKETIMGRSRPLNQTSGISVTKHPQTVTVTDHPNPPVSKGNSVTSQSKTKNDEKTQLCPICYEEISIYKIGLHAIVCTRKKADIESVKSVDRHIVRKPNNIIPSEEITLKTNIYPGPSSVVKPKSYVESFQPDSVIDCETEYISCPVCSVKVNTDIMQYHVNRCLDLTS